MHACNGRTLTVSATAAALANRTDARLSSVSTPTMHVLWQRTYGTRGMGHTGIAAWGMPDSLHGQPRPLLPQRWKLGRRLFPSREQSLNVGTRRKGGGKLLSSPGMPPRDAPRSSNSQLGGSNQALPRHGETLLLVPAQSPSLADSRPRVARTGVHQCPAAPGCTLVVKPGCNSGAFPTAGLTPLGRVTRTGRVVRRRRLGALGIFAWKQVAAASRASVFGRQPFHHPAPARCRSSGSWLPLL